MKSDLDKREAAAQKRIQAAESAIKAAESALTAAKVEHAQAMAEVLGLRHTRDEIGRAAANAEAAKARASRMAELRKKAAEPFDAKLQQLKDNLAIVKRQHPQLVSDAESRLAACERSKERALAVYA